MNTSTSRRRLAVAGLASSLALVSVACGGTKEAAPSSSAPSTEASTASPSTTVAPMTAAPTTAAPTTSVPPTTVFTPDESIQEDVNQVLHQGLASGSREIGLQVLGEPVVARPEGVPIKPGYELGEKVLNLLKGPGPVTLFIPSSYAWGLFASVIGRDVQRLFDDRELMDKIIPYLVVTTNRYTDDDLLTMDGQEITTMGGAKLKVSVQFGQAFLPGANPLTLPRTPGLTAISGALPARNGYVHVIDFVPLPADELQKLITSKCTVGKFGCWNSTDIDPRYLGYCVPENTNEACVPLTDAPDTSVPTTTEAPATTVLPDLAVNESVWDTVTDPRQTFGLFVEAIKAAGLEGVLQGPGPVTVFVPPDATFKALFDVLGLKKEEVFANKELLTQIISFLVVTGTNRYTDEDLLQMNGKELTTIGGAKMLVTTKYGKVLLPGFNPFGSSDNGVVATGGPLSYVYGSYRARNGFVHIVDWVPLSPEVHALKLLKCPTGPFGCVRLTRAQVSGPGFCDAKKPLYACVPLPKD
ncbi:MAG: hypothetical protein F2934_11680 [Actinobacteria bacterium]|uniref:Unannotated protein n=2 Tax=freshwater metagenome TaxID=449393 RepID=A0A6J6V3G4_9ZZZZ|nr:hypothetical protein [Actinomycetota bacterium]MSZ04907.1 hypothetical protein [Actinomycetota bacterium]MTB07776.1 hypothetical protein [Actinomycetota bacterium]